MDKLKEIWKGIVDKWKALEKRIKITVIISAITVLAGIIFSISAATRQSFVPLFDESIDAATVSKVDEILTNAEIAHKPTSDGKNILVVEGQEGNARIKISGEELPNSRYTFKDVISANTMGKTDEEKKLNYTYALSESIASDLENIEGINSASVNLTMPNDDLHFVKSYTISQASVQLDLSLQLNEKQIKGVANHVKFSVKGLTDDQISITDTRGNILFPLDATDTAAEATMEYDKIKEKNQQAIEKKIVEMLTPKFGYVEAQVNLKMNFDKYKETNEIVTSPIEGGKTGLIIEEHLADETSTVEATAQGEPGYGSNDESKTYLTQDGNGGSESSSSIRDTKYKVNTTVSELEKRVGEPILGDSSVSVIVYPKEYHDYNQVKKDGGLKDKSWLQYKQDVILKAAKEILELDPSVKEQIIAGTGITNVSVMGSIKPEFIEPVEADFSVFFNIVPLIILIGIIIAIAIMLSKKKEVVVETEPELSVENLLYSTRADENDLPELEEQVSDTYQRISEFIDVKPNLVAQLLKNWLNDEN